MFHGAPAHSLATRTRLSRVSPPPLPCEPPPARSKLTLTLPSRVLVAPNFFARRPRPALALPSLHSTCHAPSLYSINLLSTRPRRPAPRAAGSRAHQARVPVPAAEYLRRDFLQGRRGGWGEAVRGGTSAGGRGGVNILLRTWHLLFLSGMGALCTCTRTYTSSMLALVGLGLPQQRHAL